MNCFPTAEDKPYVEFETKHGGSDVRLATEDEVKAVRISCMGGYCNHGVIFDVDAFPWYARHCYVCGELLSVL